ncbi:MAG: DUF368 domain-containing protein [Planctomycetaceae bacterium]
MLHGEIGLSELGSLGVFALGALIGLLGFSKVLRWLLERYEMIVLAILCGFMLGSLRRIWPFQTDTTPEVTKFKDKIFINSWPDFGSGSTWLSLLLMLIAFIAVLLLDRTQRRLAERSQLKQV